MGYDALSMNAASIPKVKQAIRKVSSEQAQEMLGRVMQLEDAEMVYGYMQAKLDKPRRQSIPESRCARVVGRVMSLNYAAAVVVHPGWDPVAVSLGPLSIHWYALMYLTAFAVAWKLAVRHTKHPWVAIKAEEVEDLIFYGALGVVAGWTFRLRVLLRI